MNKDEALRCLSIAQRHRDSGDLDAARRLGLKSIKLFSTSEAELFLKSLDDSPRDSASSGGGSAAGPSSAASGAEAHPSTSGVHHRHTASSSQANGTASGSGGEKRDYTPEQHAVVKRVRACKVTEYYEILSLKRDCEEAEIKKAYRKVC
jgi:DnaJ homolog subfamily B member 12